MPYMGYDRDHLEALRRAMRRAADELGDRRCADPLALDAMRVASAVRTGLQTEWLPLLDGILGCVALEQRSPVWLSSSDLRNIVLLQAQAAGWQILTDPLNGSLSAPITEAEARAIATALADEDLDDLLDSDAEVVWLTAAMTTIGGNPTLAAAFTDAFGGAFGGDAAWAALLDHLGLERAGWADRLSRDPNDERASTRMRVLDQAMAALAAIYAAGPHEGHRGWYPTVTQHIEPYTAALLVGHLDLGREMLAAVAHDLLRRWYDAPFGVLWVDQHYAGDNAADLLFALLVAEPGAPTAFLRRAAERPELVLLTAQYDHNVKALLLAGTSPEHIDPADAGRVIVPIIDALRAPGWQYAAGHDGFTRTAPAIIGSVIAPWLLQFGPRASQWQWTADDADDALRWVIDDPATALALVDAMQRWRNHIASTELIADDGRIDEDALHDLAEMVVQLEVAFRDEEVDDAADARFWSDLGFAVAELVIPALFANPAAGLAADLTVAALSPAVQGALQRFGVIAPGEDEARQEAQRRFGSRLTDTAVIAVIATVGHLIDSGLLPPDALDGLDPVAGGPDGCGPAETGRRLRDFVTGLEPQLDPLTYESLLLVTDVFAGPAVGRIICG